MNRITTAIEAMRPRIEAVTDTQRDTLDETARFDFEEFAHIQELKSAMVGDVLTLEEAQTIYRIMGETPSHFTEQPLAERLVVVQVAEELLRKRLTLKTA